MNRFSFPRLFKVFCNTALRPIDDAPVSFTVPDLLHEAGFEEALQMPTRRKPVFVGWYRHPSGAMLLAKIWCGTFDDYHRVALEREIRLYQALGGKRLTLPAGRGTLAVPKISSASEEKERVVLVREFVPGNPLQAVRTDDEGQDICLDVALTFRSFWDILDASERALVPSGSRWRLFLAYPVSLLRGIFLVRSSGEATVFLRSLVFFFRNVHRWFYSWPSVLVHQDIHQGNILVGEGRDQEFFLVDLGECQRHHPLLEYVAMVTPQSVSRREQYLRLLGLLKDTLLLSREEETLFRTFLLVRSMTLLGERGLAREVREKFLDLMSIASEESRWERLYKRA